MTNSLVPTSTAAATARSPEELTRGPTKRELHVAIEKLFLGFPDANRTDVAKVAALYTEIISEFSAWSIKEGVERITSGKVPEINKAFLPSTAIVAHTIRTIAQNSPEQREREWRRRLTAWQAGRSWNPHWGQDPKSESFEWVCPPHLLEAFQEETSRRDFVKLANARH